MGLPVTAAPAMPAPPGPVTSTYRYLRIALAGTVVVIFVAVGVEMVQGSHLASISAYYYTGARTPFVGALIAAAVTLAALAGSGSGRVLLSIAAILAPIIALVPTPLKAGYPHWCRSAATPPAYRPATCPTSRRASGPTS
jgi:hypothetical protein